jgi:hypothetical protein
VTDRLATIRVDDFVVGVDVDTIGGFVDDPSARADAELDDVLGLAAGDGRDRVNHHLVRLRHAGGDLVLGVRGTIRFDDELRGAAPACHRPTFVAGALRGSCLRGVVVRGGELVYLLDVDAIAARKEGRECASD